MGTPEKIYKIRKVSFSWYIHLYPPHGMLGSLRGPFTWSESQDEAVRMEKLGYQKERV